MKQLIDIHRPVTICRASAGTGKTFTLAAYYVGLLLSGVDYRSILAITFTNKATAEMSERILGYLHGIAEGGEDKFLERAKTFMIARQNAPDEQLRQRAGDCFRQMLLDYDNVQIQTIDSFLQTLLGGLTGIVGSSVSAAVELDVRHVIRTAVDRMLSTEMTEADRVILEEYMQLALDRESYADVHKSLCMLAEELYNESVQILDARGEILFRAPLIASRRRAVEKQWEQDERRTELTALIDGIRTDGLVTVATPVPRPLPHVKDINRACERLRKTLKAPDKIPAKDRFRGLTETQLADAKAGKWNKLPEQVVEDTIRATELARDLARTYNTLFLTIRFSRDMELMASLQAVVQRLLNDANTALLAKTASTLSQALHTGDADFILEKAGIRFHHVLIDEFQDTSRLQWDVIEQLLRDVLASEGNTLLIVGDIKQSIYRWRNGDWHIMEHLIQADERAISYERLNPRFTSLTRNFRSSEEVVRFNLSLFDHIIRTRGEELMERIYGEKYDPDKLADFYQADKKRGGYVQYRAFPNAKDEELALTMFEQIEDLLQKGTIPSDIMILVRYKSEASLITAAKEQLDPEQYPLLTQTDIVSADSFLLEASGDVRLVIMAMKYRFCRDIVAKRYLELYARKPDVIGQIDAAVMPDTPLYEAVCELLRVLLTDADGRYRGTETAYLNTLLDRTREYVTNYGSDVEQFLLYWDEVLSCKPIPMASSNAMQILTIHASKGLQAQTLFVPFAEWEKEDGRHKPKVWCSAAVRSGSGREDFVPIQYGPEMENSDYAPAFAEEQTNLRIDNLNMLYVALTRAEDNLFVYTTYSVSASNPNGSCNHIGSYLRACYGDEYITGTPVIAPPEADEKPVEAVQAELWADSDRVRFVQSQEGALYTEYGDEAYRRMTRMDEGTLCHEIFAHIQKAEQLESVLDEFESHGEIRDPEQREKLRTLISAAWEGNPVMRPWFTAPYELRLEEAIYIDRRELRPDRVMINPETNEAIVLDYKFGRWEEQYIQQVREYMKALERMGYAPVKGYLWFAREKQGKQLMEVYGE